jgi:hypothetical protein
MYAAMTLCGQKERRPHFTGGGKRPDATPANHVDSATPISIRTSGRDRRGSGVCWIELGVVSIFRPSFECMKRPR